jgi:polar amino acid transport system substrate-binding protein
MIRALALLALASPALAEPLRIGAEPEYVPYMLQEADGTWTGFDRQMGDEICLRGGFECEWVMMPFDALIGAIQAGQIDIAIAGMANAPERQQFVDFTRAYRPESPNFGAFAGLQPALIIEGLLTGVQAGTVHEGYLADSDQPFVTFPDTATLLSALRAGEVQLIFGSWGQMDTLATSTAPDLRIVGTVELPDLSTAIAVSRKADGLVDRLNGIIDELESDGFLDGLERRWFPEGEAL